jgi:uncharacterized membrane protein
MTPLRRGPAQLNLFGRASRARWARLPRLPVPSFWSRDDDVREIVAVPAVRIGLGVAVALYVSLFSRWTVRNHYGFGTFGFDLGIFDQGMWLLSRFKEPFVTIMGLHLFGDHTSFILLPLVPFYWLFPGPPVLLVAQSFALGIAAVPLFLLARDRLRDEWLALGVAVAYLLNPAVGWANSEQFHPDVFEPPLILAALYFATRRRWVPFFACVAGALLVKEDVPLLTFVLGLYVAVRHDRRVGLITAGVSALWFSAAVWWILPAFNEIGSLDTWRLPFGSVGGFFRTSLTQPWKLVDVALGPDRPWYVWQLLAPFALLPLLAPSLAIVAIGPLALNVLSTFWYQYHIEYHYTTLIVPVLAAAAAFGIAHLRSMHTRAVVVAGLVLVAAVSGYLWGPSQFARNPAPLGDPSRPEASEIRAALARIPDEAAVSAHYGYVTHLGHREHIYEFPVPWHAVNWADYSLDGQRLPQADLVEYIVLPTQLDAKNQALLDARRAEGFQNVYSTTNVMVLKKRAT